MTRDLGRTSVFFVVTKAHFDISLDLVLHAEICPKASAIEVLVPVICARFFLPEPKSTSEGLGLQPVLSRAYRPGLHPLLGLGFLGNPGTNNKKYSQRFTVVLEILPKVSSFPHCLLHFA